LWPDLVGSTAATARTPLKINERQGAKEKTPSAKGTMRFSLFFKTWRFGALVFNFL
jgi:hypothetical protein